ncbi:MAG: NAD-dependent deacetylase sirtuin 2 [Bacillariaceae sp.]|jgi:NAD-dependent deacetylase sirtuin 2
MNIQTAVGAVPSDLASLARLILSQECKSIIVLTGAGVSVASGIPDFRSPGGMYDTLQPKLLTAELWQQQLMEQDPTNVVNWEIFQKNSFPYLEVRRPFILGTRNQKWKATIANHFFELLDIKTNNKLTRIYTQNIDGLQKQCQELLSTTNDNDNEANTTTTTTTTSNNKIVNVHGTISEAQCEGCGKDMNFDTFCDQVQSNIKDIYNIDKNAPNQSTPIVCTYCGKAQVKPKTVLFGGELPAEFFECCEEDLPKCDLLIIAGTSLVVSPANSLVHRVPDNTIRVIINNEPVGEELGIDYGRSGSKPNNNKRDYFVQGDCDEVFLNLIEELGWLDDLHKQINNLPPKSANLVRPRYNK